MPEIHTPEQGTTASPRVCDGQGVNNEAAMGDIILVLANMTIDERREYLDTLLENMTLRELADFALSLPRKRKSTK